jgi:predicted DNA-binding protein
MTTSKRRLMLSLSSNLDQAIDRLAVAQGRPRASVVVEILEEMVPSLNALSEAVEVSKSAPEQAYNKLFGLLSSAMAQGGAIGQSMASELDAVKLKEVQHD